MLSLLRPTEMGASKVKSTDGTNADVDEVATELNQTQSQTLKDDFYNAVLTICGMPNRNGGSSTSDTGSDFLAFVPVPRLSLAVLRNNPCSSDKQTQRP